MERGTLGMAYLTRNTDGHARHKENREKKLEVQLIGSCDLNQTCISALTDNFINLLEKNWDCMSALSFMFAR